MELPHADLSYRIIAAAIEVRLRGLHVEIERFVPLYYKA
jgi:hypothetical protein